jgi:hypothetical protein
MTPRRMFSGARGAPRRVGPGHDLAAVVDQVGATAVDMGRSEQPSAQKTIEDPEKQENGSTTSFVMR